ncbi:MAG TPA: flagellar biosynthesis protein FlhF [Nitrococcus sp.]|nr:flagellar biosynthesis protein FlhF [Nitrococcus sp.]
MKIKRIFAADMRQAIRQVRESHGPDAVILSSRNVDGGVEVISAVDYDEGSVRAALESTPAEPESSLTAAADFQAVLGRTLRRKADANTPARRLNVTVGDAVDLDFSTADADAEEPTKAAAPAGEPPLRIEWTQEPAMREMRAELRTLRNLFESQLKLQEWQRLGQRHPLRVTLLQRLTELGLGSDVARKLADHVPEAGDPEQVWSKAMALLRRHLPVADDDIVEHGGVIAIVGPTGVGKTTTVAKLAARFALRHGRRHVALVTTDNFRIGGQEQLRSFARILGLPVHAANDREELAAVLADLGDKRLVLIDTTGMSHRDMRLAEQLHTLETAGSTIRAYLVVSANTQLTALCEIVRGFRKVKPAGCILSKVDEATSLGSAMTAMLRYRLPVAYLGTGQRVPEDLQPARNDRLLESALALMQRYTGEQNDDESLALRFAGAATAWQ